MSKLFFFQVHGHHPPPEAAPLLHLYKGCDCPDLDCSRLTGFPSVLLQRDEILLPQNRVHGRLAGRLWRNTSTKVKEQDELKKKKTIFIKDCLTPCV